MDHEGCLACAAALRVHRILDGAEELRGGEGGFVAAVLCIAKRKNTLRDDKVVIIH